MTDGTFYIDGEAVGTFNSMAGGGTTRLGTQYGDLGEYLHGSIAHRRV